MRIDEQVDVTGTMEHYSWILTAPYRMRKELEGYFGVDKWKWIRGKPGAYVCQDYALAATTAGMFGLKITSNGTHAAHGRPMYRDCSVG